MKRRIVSLAVVLALLASLVSLPSLADGNAVRPGTLFRFGYFEQDLSASNGPEPILWRVLDVDEASGLALAVSEYGLYTMKYHRSNSRTAWGDTDVRDWLNTVFLASFTEQERQQLALTEVSGSMDRVFLLDSAQIVRYLTEPYLCYATPRALREEKPGAYVNEDTGGSSWLVRTDVAQNRIAWVGGGGKLYSPTGQKGVNYMNTNDNVVRPAVWIRLEACGAAASPSGSPIYASTLMRLSTRSGPDTDYNGLGDYFDDNGGEPVRVLSRKLTNSVWWLEIEFEYKDVTVRCYTGAKRIAVDVSRVPDDPSGFQFSATVAYDTDAWYGPGTSYKMMPARLTPPAGTTGAVVREENGWYCLEYENGNQKVRVWLPSDTLVLG